jgi:outer membrane protein assembly factor BamA
MRRIFPTFLFMLLFLHVSAQKLKSCADSLETFRINNIQLSGNKITYSKIILRELALKKGDKLCAKQLQKGIQKSKENLQNTSLFNFVDIRDSSYVEQGVNQIDIYINLAERWYIWPMPVFELAERNPNAWWLTKDFSKINYGMFFTWENFRGRREALKLIVQGGYDEKFGFHYDIPFINKAQTLGIILGAGLLRNHEVTYNTINNKPVRYRDKDYIRHQYYAYAALNLRKNIHTSHYFELAFDAHQYGDIVFQLNPQFEINSNQDIRYLSLTYFYKNDHRDSRTYPLKGYYLDGILLKRGLGILPKTSVNLLSLTTNLRKYWQLSDHWYFASGFTGRIANTSKNPYFLNTGLGYSRDFVRGYEYYVVDGQNFALVKTDLKYGLFQNKITKLPVLPSKFSKIEWSVYLSFYLDAAYSTTEIPQISNTLQNEALLGYGAGINLVSYYDIVIRFEYSANRMGEKGLFISFMASI